MLFLFGTFFIVFTLCMLVIVIGIMVQEELDSRWRKGFKFDELDSREW